MRKKFGAEKVELNSSFSCACWPSTSKSPVTVPECSSAVSLLYASFTLSSAAAAAGVTFESLAPVVGAALHKKVVNDSRASRQSAGRNISHLKSAVKFIAAECVAKVRAAHARII